MSPDGAIAVKEALELQNRIGWVATALVILVGVICLFIWRAAWPLFKDLVDSLKTANREATVQLHQVTREFLEALATRDRSFESFSKSVIERLDRIDVHMARQERLRDHPK